MKVWSVGDKHRPDSARASRHALDQGFGIPIALAGLVIDIGLTPGAGGVLARPELDLAAYNRQPLVTPILKPSGRAPLAVSTRARELRSLTRLFLAARVSSRYAISNAR
jgi:hypothetical protein